MVSFATPISSNSGLRGVSIFQVWFFLFFSCRYTTLRLWNTSSIYNIRTIPRQKLRRWGGYVSPSSYEDRQLRRASVPARKTKRLRARKTKSLSPQYIIRSPPLFLNRFKHPLCIVHELYQGHSQAQNYISWNRNYDSAVRICFLPFRNHPICV